jgi:hypothetical protein
MSQVVFFDSFQDLMSYSYVAVSEYQKIQVSGAELGNRKVFVAA